MWLDEVEEDQMYPEAAELRRRNFNAPGITNYVLQKLLILGFETSTSNPGRSGVTVIIRNPVPGPRKHLISVKIAAEMVWPLLVQEYSAAEKTAVSMHIANTLLHELSVSYRPLPPSPHDVRNYLPPSDHLVASRIQVLETDLSNYMCSMP